MAFRFFIYSRLDLDFFYAWNHDLYLTYHTYKLRIKCSVYLGVFFLSDVRNKKQKRLDSTAELKEIPYIKTSSFTHVTYPSLK